MSQTRLNNLMTMYIYIHREETDKLSLETCLNTFISSNEHGKKYLELSINFFNNINQIHSTCA